MSGKAGRQGMGEDQDESEHRELRLNERGRAPSQPKFCLERQHEPRGWPAGAALKPECPGLFSPASVIFLQCRLSPYWFLMQQAYEGRADGLDRGSQASIPLARKYSCGMRYSF